MISIIICSKNREIPHQLRESIKNTVGVVYEIIVIDNSKKNHSIFSAYNKGVSQSKFDFLCFVHEDVLFLTKDWGEKLKQHLNKKNTGIIGIAGAKIMTKTPASWSVGNRYKNIIQYKSHKLSASLEKEPRNFYGVRQSAILLDGVFLAMRHELFNEIKFDESFYGFHGYDYDISVQSIIAGYNNYVVYDILLKHYSKGYRNQQYYLNLIKVFKKWEKYLPLICEDDAKGELEIHRIEITRLKKLIRRLAETGFSTIDIIANTKYFVDKLNTDEAKKQLKFIQYKILFQKLINAPFFFKMRSHLV